MADPATRYEVCQIQPRRSRMTRRVLRAFAEFEEARLFAVRRLDACKRHGLHMDYTGVVCDRDGYYLFSIVIQRVN